MADPMGHVPSIVASSANTRASPPSAPQHLQPPADIHHLQQLVIAQGIDLVSLREVVEALRAEVAALRASQQLLPTAPPAAVGAAPVFKCNVFWEMNPSYWD